MPFPNFFIVGAQKCGTTAWVSYLGTHPDICFSEIKEPHYFASDLAGVRRVTSVRDYSRLFDGCGSAKAVGEASAAYLYSRTAAEAIKRFNPEARIIVFLRDQSAFLKSLHHQYLYAFEESIEDFETAWRLSGSRDQDSLPRTCQEPKLLNYVLMGDFRRQVERFLDAFPAEQVRVFDFGDWTENPRETYLEILSFLGLDDDGRRNFPQINSAKSHGRKWLGRFISHPPAFVARFVSLLKTLLGRQRLGLGAWAAQRIAVPGYRTSMPDRLRDEIRGHYEMDNAVLRKRLIALGIQKPPRPVSTAQEQVLAGG